MHSSVFGNDKTPSGKSKLNPATSRGSAQHTATPSLAPAAPSAIALLAALAAFAVLLAASLATPATALAASATVTTPRNATPALASALRTNANGGTVTSGDITVSDLDDFGGLSMQANGAVRYFDLQLAHPTTGDKISLTSSNPAVAYIDPGYSEIQVYGSSDNYFATLFCYGKNPGTATVTASANGSSVSFPVVVYPSGTSVTSVSKASYDSVKVQWKAVPGASGYLVQRAQGELSDFDTQGYSTLATVYGAAKTSATVKAPWKKAYTYRVVPFVEYGKTKYLSDYPESKVVAFTLKKPSMKITAVKKAGKSNLKITWTASAGAESYRVLRSTTENRNYKCIATTKAKSYVDKKTKANITYYYKVEAIYAGRGAIASQTVAQMRFKKSKALSKRLKTIPTDINRPAFCYTQGSKIYTVSRFDTKLVVAKLNANLKKAKKKTVKLPKHDLWGGFFHGPDGNNYVAIGYDNYKESNSKTVIKVLKFNKNWKKLKTATIKGSASNEFEGIHQPFHVGDVSFDMQGDTLYLFTSRTMFEIDGVNHQSNIAFKIDTKTMKAKESNVSYVSHSFNQRVRFKDGSIYLADRGDAFPRAIQVATQDNFGTRNAETRAYEPFKFKGEVGDNFTGGSVGGMEVGRSNVLVCGAAQPHYLKVAGVSGFKHSYKNNVFVTTTNRKTGKSSVHWLTKMNPKGGKYFIGNVRMVKITDNRFGVLYQVSNYKSGKSVVRYDVVNDAGKRVSSKTYKKLRFDEPTQPIVANGKVYWTQTEFIGNSSRSCARIYAIPALG